MKKIIIAIALVSGFLVLNSCKGKEKTEESTDTTSTEVSTDEASTSSQPKSYTVTATPESATVGKNKEVTLKIINLNAVELTDPDGKSTGILLSYEYEATNNNKVGGSGVVIDPAQFRLVLDNENKLSHDNYTSLGVDAESTKSMPGNSFKLPVGTKPVALNLFFDETSSSVKLEMK